MRPDASVIPFQLVRLVYQAPIPLELGTKNSRTLFGACKDNVPTLKYLRLTRGRDPDHLITTGGEGQFFWKHPLQ